MGAKGKFINELVTVKVGPRTRRLYHSYEYVTSWGDSIVVHEGFLTDYASIPRIFWSILPPDGLWAGAAVIHDFLYYTQTKERDYADKVFLDAMETLGVSLWKRRVMYRAVNIFGRIGWRRRRDEIVVENARRT